MRQSSYTDEEGRRRAVWLPDGAPDSDAQMGLPLGPPDLGLLGLPPEVEIRLHNQLFDRGLLRAKDVLRRRQEVFAALQAAFRVETERIVVLYLESEAANADNQKDDSPPVGRRRTGG